jgi:transglutaminase-like putative cysteine protease
VTIRLSIEHRTGYRYDAEVRGSKNEARMAPSATTYQRIVTQSFDTTPRASYRSTYRDYFGAIVEAFEIRDPHTLLEVVSRTVVDSDPQREVEPAGGPYEASSDPTVEYRYGSPMIVPDTDVAALAASLRVDDERTTVANVLGWFNAEMTYEHGSTEVGTGIGEVLRSRRGVCQDYAHLCIGLFRLCEIPARYVSGYFAPRDLEVGERVDSESHAWVDVFITGHGWWAVDVTNAQPTGERHVRIGAGRDYSDMIPFQGVHLGQATQKLTVAVTIERLA